MKQKLKKWKLYLFVQSYKNFTVVILDIELINAVEHSRENITHQSMISYASTYDTRGVIFACYQKPVS